MSYIQEISKGKITLTFLRKVKMKPFKNKALSSSLSILQKMIPSRVKKVELTLTLCGKRKIRSLNKQYRGKDKVTDVLSFQMHEKFDAKNLPPMLDLGDIYICAEKVRSQAKKWGMTEQEEFIRLFVHGFLHLCGHDHETSAKDEKAMMKIQEEMIWKIQSKLS